MDSYWRVAFIAMGSNIVPRSNLPRALRYLAGLGRQASVSTAWLSAPVGDVNQPHFVNAAVMVETRWSPPQLRTMLRRIERRLGRRRVPHNKNAPRTIDLDLVAFNGAAQRWNDMVLPDCELKSRAFVAVPLAELAPHHRPAESWPPFAVTAGRLLRNGAVLRPMRDLRLTAPGVLAVRRWMP